MPKLLDLKVKQGKEIEVVVAGQVIQARYDNAIVTAQFIDEQVGKGIDELIAKCVTWWDLTTTASDAVWLHHEGKDEDGKPVSRPTEEDESEVMYPLTPFALRLLPMELLNVTNRAILRDQLPKDPNSDESETSF